MKEILPKLETQEQLDEAYSDWLTKDLGSTGTAFEKYIRTNYSIINLFKYMVGNQGVFLDLKSDKDVYIFFSNILDQVYDDNLVEKIQETMKMGNVSSSPLSSRLNTPQTQIEPEQIKGVLEKPRHNHYYKSCPYDNVDVYRLIQLYNIVDPCIQHAFKKLLVAGARGHKDIDKDIQDVIDSLIRWQEMKREDSKLLDK
jgi:hypothetical protein